MRASIDREQAGQLDISCMKKVCGRSSRIGVGLQLEHSIITSKSACSKSPSFLPLHEAPSSVFYAELIA
jgi:hypothetical protein